MDREEKLKQNPLLDTEAAHRRINLEASIPGESTVLSDQLAVQAKDSEREHAHPHEDGREGNLVSS